MKIVERVLVFELVAFWIAFAVGLLLYGTQAW